MGEGGKRVLLGVTGCIAAYKACEVLRELQRAGIDVRVIMTEAASEFVSPTTFRALSGHEVGLGLFGQPDDAIPHIGMTHDADAFLIAPATANAIARIAHGIADDLLTAAALACTAPLVLAPAMNANMYENPATQDNIATLVDRGACVIEPQSGRLACGDVGRGKLADPEEIVRTTLRVLGMEEGTLGGGERRDLAGLEVLVTAGPTIERIDPVRFLSNPSSGRMGYAIAEAALRRGASATLVSGPVSLEPPHGAKTIRVESAEEMLDAARSAFPAADIAVFTAAVSDMRPEHAYERKLKKGIDDEELSTLHLVPNPDILATLAHGKGPRQVCVGFAAETDDVLANARAKLASKRVDMIVGNRVGPGIGFGAERIESILVTQDGVVENGTLSKTELADRILTNASSLIH